MFRKLFAWFFLIFTVLAIFSCKTKRTQNDVSSSAPMAGGRYQELKNVLATTINYINSIKKSDGSGDYWNTPSRLGLHYSAQYYIFSKWIGLSKTSLDVATLKHELLKTRLADGSWYAIQDSNRISTDPVIAADFNATIFNYWALKIMSRDPVDQKVGEDLNGLDFALTTEFIKKNGGLEASATFTKYFLCLFDQFPWDAFPVMPLSVVFSDIGQDLVIKQFAQWVIPHLKPIAYLRSQKVHKNLGPNYDISELFISPKALPNSLLLVLDKQLEAFFSRPGKLLNKIINPPKHLVEDLLLHEQKPKGSWGAYTLATMFTMITLDHYQTTNFDQLSPEVKGAIATAMNKGQGFIEELYFHPNISPNYKLRAAYYGVLDDGSYWDTALLTRGLMEVGYDELALKSIANFFVDKQQKESGGIPFGYDFETYPDNDDTAEVGILFDRFPEFKTNANRAAAFVIGMQNKDGGWGAFNKDNTGNLISKIGSGSVADSADRFDESSPDVTGHMLEFLGRRGFRIGKDSVVDRAVEFIKSKRYQAEGVWEARWALNILYGTRNVIEGLRQIGIPQNDRLIQDAAAWVKSVQNPDGGWGESTRSYQDYGSKKLSYRNNRWQGQGISTATQTAWAVSILVDAGMAGSEAVSSGIDYLISVNKEGVWTDASVTGTGHPGIIYMEYPSYPESFALVAIGKYVKSQCGEARSNFSDCLTMLIGQ